MKQYIGWLLAGGDSYKSLIRHHKYRRQQRRSTRRRLFEGRVSIRLRQKIVADKRRFGDWESDSMEGGKSKSGLATHVERKSRYLVAGKLNNKRSDTFMAVSTALFKQTESRLIKTFTVDNGSQFVQFKTLEEATNSKVYFADPYSPWHVVVQGHLFYVNELLFCLIYLITLSPKFWLGQKHALFPSR